MFDAFGTLVRIGERLSPYRKLLMWMSDNGRPLRADDASRIMSQPLGLADAAKLFGMSPSIELLSSWEADLSAEVGSIQLFPDAIPSIERLIGAGYRVGLCSNLAAPYGAPVKALLPPLSAYALSYEVGAVKPEPGIYRYLLDQLGCAASDVLFIGDTLSADLDGPRAFGMSSRLLNRKAGQVLNDILRDV